MHERDAANFERLRDDFLAHFWRTHPVDASFVGLTAYDGSLPATGHARAATERRELDALAARLDRAALPDEPAARIDAQLMRGYLRSTLAGSERHARRHNPAWYTGEVAFGIIALLLPGTVPRAAADLARRIDAIPELFAGAGEALAHTTVPADWVRRARTETAAIRRLLQTSLPLHPLGAAVAPAATVAAAAAIARFDRCLAMLSDADPAAGGEYFAVLAREVHGLEQTPAEIERLAAAEFERQLAEIEIAAARLDPAVPWRAAVAALNSADGEAAAVRTTFQYWHARACADAAALVTPATEYALDAAELPTWAQPVFADLYFLYYRSPAAYAPGSGSIYWLTAPHSTATMKLVHAVHHGSIGHHTQNARARHATSQLARIAASDGASGIALLGGGSLAEGWACYAESLVAEVPDFYTPQEELLRRAHELRNVATCLGDVRLHTGGWDLASMRRFYAQAGFAPERIWAETTRNSMFPASRIMYWLGTREIRALRAASPLSAKPFHDALLGYGSAPVMVIGMELRRAAQHRQDPAAGAPNLG